MSPMSFGLRLHEASLEHGRLCVGIDPHPQLLAQWGLEDTPTGLATFCDICCDALSGHVALVKPQVAFFERHGSSGLRVLEELLSRLREDRTLSLADAKRGDIGSTMAGYGYAWLNPQSPIHADAVTLSPYLGVGSLTPAFQEAKSSGGGVFVLAATSNPEARALQETIDAHRPHAGSIAQRVIDEVAELNRADDVGSFGVVLGATVHNPPHVGHLNGPVLLPGVGAQGATARDVARITKGITHLAFPNISRGILRCGPSVNDLRKAVKTAGQMFPGVSR